MYRAGLRGYILALVETTTTFPNPDFYPTFDRLVQKFDPSSGTGPLLVGLGPVRDVLRDFNDRFPGNEQYVKLLEQNPNPFDAKRAKAYYRRDCLRGLDDTQCMQLLERQRAVMLPGYSILLLEEITFPSRHTNWMLTSWEQAGSAIGTELQMGRTSKRLRDMFKKAGFTVRCDRPALGFMTLWELSLELV